MTLKGQSTVFKHGKAATLYLTLPSMLAQDSKCPVKEGDNVEVEIRGEYVIFHKVPQK
jgi:hypothetical protein